MLTPAVTGSTPLPNLILFCLLTCYTHGYIFVFMIDTHKGDTAMTRQELMSELVTLQNQIDYQDVLTISAFMNEAQLAKHVEAVRKQVAR